MYSVTRRIRETKQPRGGYIKPSSMMKTEFDDGVVLHENENISPSITGMAVDYLTRFLTDGNKRKAFDISIRGVANAIRHKRSTKEETFAIYDKINGLDDESIINACKLVSYDVWYRNLPAALMSPSPNEINPDKNTIENIRIMVKRGLTFFENYGPVIKYDFDFKPNGYTMIVSCGDGDFLTKDTLWDFKVSAKEPTKENTLQLLMYFIMGKHSGQDIYKDIKNIGVFNPRLNAMYTLDMSLISEETIAEIENLVICY